MEFYDKTVADVLMDLQKQAINPFADMHRLEEDLRENIKKASEAAAEFNRNLSDATRQFEEEIERFFSIARSTKWDHLSFLLVDLAEYGWYINYRFDMFKLGKIRQCIDKEQIGEMDQLMENWIIADWKSIKELVLSNHPERNAILTQAFYAHEEGLYLLSVPVFFAQIDGICGELTGYKFFLNKQLGNNTFVPKVREWVTNNSRTGIDQAISAVLMYKGAFQLHESQSNKIGFTRHSILHGETNDYGNRTNSLKAISLLAYISDVCSRK